MTLSIMPNNIFSLSERHMKQKNSAVKINAKLTHGQNSNREHNNSHSLCNKKPNKLKKSRTRKALLCEYGGQCMAWWSYSHN